MTGMVTDEVKAQEQRESRIWSHIRASGVPVKSRAKCRLEATIERDGNHEAINAVKDFLEFVDTDRWLKYAAVPFLWLYGISGVGKSHLALVVALVFLEEELSVAYCQVEDELNDLQSMLEDGPALRRRWKFLKTCRLLILDDIGAHNSTPWRTSQLDALVDYRYREELPLILTSNTVSLSDRIVDRCRDGRVVAVRGESWRGKDKHGK